MSMISSLIDELRKAALEARKQGQVETFVLMRDAADTIWQLRDDLQQANGLMDEVEHDESRAWDRVRKAEAENAKLREQLAKARDPQRIGGTADPESFVYAIEQLREFRWQHATNDEDAIPYINNVADAHERENAKLQNDADLLRAMLSQERTEKQSYMAENDRLRDGANAMRQLYEDELKHALAENAKLRELVVDMYKAFMHGACYRWCEFKEPCNYISDGKCQWYDRGHELGVEVNE